MTLIALDVMSGDLGAQECVPAALLALESDSSLRLQLVGQASVIAPLLDAAAPAAGVRDRLELIEASEIITMTDAPREAIRRKKQSSMRIAADLVHDGLAEGMVSAGNTGALTAISHFVLKCLPEVERAPIMTSIPNRRAFTQLLDVGANLRATPVQLRQFAIMGAIVARDVHGRERPRVGLLNIGEEETKGHDLVQEAHALLKDLRVAFEYVGFVEGQDIFSGEVDVVVTDGFTGNVALKTMEGVAGLIGDRLKREFTAVLKRVSGSLDPRRYNGAIMVGLKHIVVKSHGSADRYAMAQAIAIAATAVRKQLVQHVSQALGSGDHSTC